MAALGIKQVYIQLMPRIFAHRGGAGYFVENTLRAFEFALELGCDGAECDVHLSRDGEVIVHHNPGLNHHYARTPDGAWIGKEDETRFAQLSLSQIQQYTIGEPNPQIHAPEIRPELQAATAQHIPTLRQVIETIKNRSATFQLVIEIKSDIFNPEEHYGKLLVDQTLKTVREEDFVRQTILCSFDWRTLLYAQNRVSSIPLWFTTHPFSWLNPGEVPESDIPPGFNYLARLRTALSDNNAHWYAGFRVKTPEDFPRLIKKAGGQTWFCYHTDATRNNLKRAHANGLELAAWSVNLRESNAPDNLKNVDAVCVDYPGDWL
jgi:glycerophosphoryl diester phosphodiesterase